MCNRFLEDFAEKCTQKAQQQEDALLRRERIEKHRKYTRDCLYHIGSIFMMVFIYSPFILLYHIAMLIPKIISIVFIIILCFFVVVCVHDIYCYCTWTIFGETPIDVELTYPQLIYQMILLNRLGNSPFCPKYSHVDQMFVSRLINYYVQSMMLK